MRPQRLAVSYPRLRCDMKLLGAVLPFAAVLLALVAAALALGLRASSDDAAGDEPAPGPSLRIILSGSSAGQLRVCRCSEGEHGGWDRLATIVKEKRSQGPAILLDGGAFLRAQGLRPDETADSIFEMLKSLEYTAVNIAEHEMGLGRASVSAKAKAAGVPALSANLVGSDGEPIIAPFLVKTIPSGDFEPPLAEDFRVGILALTSSSCDLNKYPKADNSTLRVQDPIGAADRYMPDLRSQADLLIVLCDLKAEEIDSLVAAHPEIDAVACGRRHQPDELRGVSKQVGQTLVFYGGKDLFKHYGLLEFTFGSDGTILTAEGSCDLLEKGRIEQDEETARLIASLIKAQAAAIRAQTPSRAPSGPQKQYAGVSICKRCHASHLRQWETTDHARAFQTLTADEQLEPDCVSCHTTGYGTGGFVAKRSTPKLTGVQCEVCHGPGVRHAANPSASVEFADPMASCLDCHTERRSPKYEPDAYRSRILHTSGADQQ